MPQNLRDRRTPRPAGPTRPPLDAVDLALLRALRQDGRLTNAELASRAGIAPSTCVARLRALRERKVLRGVHADVDLAEVGAPLQAMVAVRLRAHDRAEVESFRLAAPRLPGVLAVFHLAGADDYLLHLALPSAEALRDFVLDHLTGHPAVAHTQTSLVFEHVAGAGVPALSPRP